MEILKFCPTTLNTNLVIGKFLGEESGIVTEEPGRVVCLVVAIGIGWSFSPVAFVLVSKEPEGLFTLKSFGIKFTPRIRSLGAILRKI